VSDTTYTDRRVELKRSLQFHSIFVGQIYQAERRWQATVSLCKYFLTSLFSLATTSGKSVFQDFYGGRSSSVLYKPFVKYPYVGKYCFSHESQSSKQQLYELLSYYHAWLPQQTLTDFSVATMLSGGASHVMTMRRIAMRGFCFLSVQAALGQTL
jgi:hypothetical protein